MQQNIDNLINWIQFYSQYLDKSKLKPAGSDKMSCLCPFHNDTKNSFWFNVKNGLWKCEACGEQGNGQVFLEKIEGIDNKEAYKKLLQLAGIEKTKNPRSKKAYTIEQYAKDKKLPVEFLLNFGISNMKLGIKIPYYNENNEVIATRKRYNGEGAGPKFLWEQGSKLIPYGVWRLPEFTEGYIVLVEGESDTHTLWLYGVPCLGVPGASTFQRDWVKYIDKYKTIYYIKEPDVGGETFTKKLCEALHTENYQGTVKAITLKNYKDPSELHKNTSTEDFSVQWKVAMETAQEVNLASYSPEKLEQLEGLDFGFKTPAGWRVSLQGIEYLNEKTGMWTLACRTPVLITKRYRNKETGDEKLELAYYRDKNWHKMSVKRSVVFQTRTITQLADAGITVSSENSRLLVKFLSDFEVINIDHIKLSLCVSQLGWHGKHFIPGADEGLSLDTDLIHPRWGDAYSTAGDLDEWIKIINSFRNNNIFRFILASAFATPLLDILKHRVFVIHNWADSRAGKTAALKATLSVWGNPESLMANFNATKVGLERMAGFFSDLPLGIDEKQVATGNKQNFIESLIYMLSLGSSKIRGTKTGGVQNITTWRSIILTTGEEPITTQNSQSGIYTRTLEIYGAPFDSEDEAKLAHDLVTEHYGHAGRIYIKKLIEQSKDKLKQRYKEIMNKLSKEHKDKLSTHISSVAVVTLADELASNWIFGYTKDDSMYMAKQILESIENQEDADIIERAYRIISDWLISNTNKFKEDTYLERYGAVEENEYYIFPSILDKFLKENNFSPKKVIQGLGDREIIETKIEGDKKRYQVTKRIAGKVVRVYKFTIQDEEETPPF